jgi:hypothetical protein
MPDSNALQVFYGSIPVLLVIVSAVFQMHRDSKVQHVLLKDVLDRLGRIETGQDAIKGEVHGVKERLVVLETRAGSVFTGR